MSRSGGGQRPKLPPSPLRPRLETPTLAVEKRQMPGNRQKGSARHFERPVSLPEKQLQR